MRGVVDGRARMSTGTNYQINGYDLIGKTGTAQIASSTGGYLKGSTNYVRSFAGMFPGDDPEIIVYVAASKMNGSKYLPESVKDLVKNVGTYLNIYGESSETEEEVFETESYINKNIDLISEKIISSSLEPVILGEGDKIIKQYPLKNTLLNTGNKIFLVTNSNEYKMPDINGWSRSEVEILCKLLNINVTFDGYGYVTNYSIEKNSVMDNNVLEVTLEVKYKEEKKE